MSITCTVLKKVESVKGDSLLIGLPDDKGQYLTLDEGLLDEDLDGLKVGGRYSIAFIPFVPVDHPEANMAGAPADATEVPVDHPVVLGPVPEEKDAAPQQQSATADAASSPVADASPAVPVQAASDASGPATASDTATSPAQATTSPVSEPTTAAATIDPTSTAATGETGTAAETTAAASADATATDPGPGATASV